jgi:hypothetical protein
MPSLAIPSLEGPSIVGRLAGEAADTRGASGLRAECGDYRAKAKQISAREAPGLSTRNGAYGRQPHHCCLTNIGASAPRESLTRGAPGRPREREQRALFQDRVIR